MCSSRSPELEQNKSQLAWATKVLCVSLPEATDINLVLDQWFAKPNENGDLKRHDGSAWAGSLGDAIGTVDEDLVGECLSYSFCHKDGVFGTATVTYERVDGDLVFDWDDVHIGWDGKDGQDRFEGVFPEFLREAFETPKLIETAKSEVGFDLNEFFGEEAAIHMKSVAVKIVMNQLKWNVAIPVHDEAERETLKHSMEEGPFSENLRMYNEDQIEEIRTLEEQFNL